MKKMKKVILAVVALLSIQMATYAQAVPAKKAEPIKKEAKVVKHDAKASTAKVATSATKPAAKTATVVTHTNTPSAKSAASSKPAIVKSTSNATTHLKKDGTPDKRFKESKHLKKDGTPDKRYKENKIK